MSIDKQTAIYIDGLMRSPGVTDEVIHKLWQAGVSQERIDEIKEYISSRREEINRQTDAK